MFLAALLAATIDNSAITNNHDQRSQRPPEQESGRMSSTLTITDGSITGNQTAGDGGGIYNVWIQYRRQSQSLHRQYGSQRHRHIQRIRHRDRGEQLVGL